MQCLLNIEQGYTMLSFYYGIDWHIIHILRFYYVSAQRTDIIIGTVREQYRDVENDCHCHAF